MTKATFPEVREALAAEHTDLPWIGAGPSYGAPLPMELTSVVTDTEPDSECDITICRDAVTPDVLLICAAVNAAPAMLAHIDAQAAEIERQAAALKKYEADDVRYLRNMAEKDAEIERLHAGIANSHMGIERLIEALEAYINDYAGDDGMYAPKHYAQMFRAALEQTK